MRPDIESTTLSAPPRLDLRRPEAYSPLVTGELLATAESPDRSGDPLNLIQVMLAKGCSTFPLFLDRHQLLIK